MNLAEEIAKWQQTGNHAHATDILYHLAKVFSTPSYESIKRIHDADVGHGSGAPLKSGLLWAVIDSHEAKNRALHEENEQLKAELKTSSVDAIENFVNTMIGALESGFVEEGPITLAEIYLFMRCHIKDNYGCEVEPLDKKWGKEIAELCSIGIEKAEPA